MPLRAIQPDGTTVFASDLDEVGWGRVRDSIRRQREGWRLPCCDSQVVAKTSSLGTRFFAHFGRGACEWGSETEHHIRLKALAVEVARRHGWHAATEVTGRTPDGDAWKADVLARRGRICVAVEVQWSSQTNEDLQQRQERYVRAGVRALWLIRAAGFPVSGQLPAAAVREVGRGNYEARIPAVSAASMRRECDWAYRGISAEALLDAAFAGHLRWGIKNGEPVSWTVEGATINCWRCGERTTSVTGITVDVSATLAHLSIYSFDKDIEFLREIFPEEVRREHRVGQIKPRFSKTEGSSYVSNGCFVCGALQGRHFEYEYWDKATVRHSGHAVVDARWKRFLEPRFPRHWRLLGVKPTRFASDADGFISYDDDD